MDETQPKKSNSASALWIGIGVAGGLALYHVISKMAAETAARTAGNGYLPPVRERVDAFELDY